MNFKLLLTTLACGVSSVAMADADGVWANGVVVYLHPNGNLVERGCDLWVPQRGEGEVKLQCDSWSTLWSVSSKNFFTTKTDNKTIFTVFFDDIPGAPVGTKAVYSGAYLRGKNYALYYGDVFSVSSDENNPSLKYVGGFKFTAQVPVSPEANK